jgi:hypothetical protein
VLEHYTGPGFQVTGIFPVARDKDNLRIVEFDCVMLREANTHSTPGRMLVDLRRLAETTSRISVMLTGLARRNAASA